MKQGHLLGLTSSTYCTFCKIIRKEESSYIVFENEQFIAFLDKKPLFPGHCLLVPKGHIENFDKLPHDQIAPLFEFSQVLSKAIETSMHAHGTFIAINNKVSQSVPHLHVHVSPRRFKDGLKGFFWPRNPYQSAEHMAHTQTMIVQELQKLLSKNEDSIN